MKLITPTPRRRSQRFVTVLMVFCLWICMATGGPNAQAGQSNNPIKPAPKRNVCEQWFEQVWPQLSLAGQLPAHPKAPPKCRANPWVHWVYKQQPVVHSPPPAPGKPTFAALTDPFFANLNALQQAVTWGEQGRLREAYDLLRRLAKEQPEWPEIYYNLGIVLELRGELAQSKHSFEYALDLCSFSPCRIPRESTEQHIEQLTLFLKAAAP